MRTALLIALFACLLISSQAFAIHGGVDAALRIKREKAGYVQHKAEILGMLARDAGHDEEELEKVLTELKDMEKEMKKRSMD